MSNRARVDSSLTTIDNTYYDRLGDEWWSTTGEVAGLHAMNPARAAYFESSFEGAGIALAGARVLDVGCGGGILAEALAARGARIVGVDRSLPSLAAARRHGTLPAYAGADAAALPFADGVFDGLISSDFLEHVHDLEAVAREMSRVVRPGGVVAFDTINRTFAARLIAIWVMERLVRRIPRHTHDYRLFIRPNELREAFSAASLDVRELRGLSPKGFPLANLARVATNRALAFEVGEDLSVSYLGFAVKRAATETSPP